MGRVRGVGRGDAGDGRGGPGGRPHRRPPRGAAVDARPGTQQRLRRPRSPCPRLGDRLPAEHESRARDQRGARLRRDRARGEVVRPVRGDQGRRPPPDAVDRGRRLGQRDRQHARPRDHVHALRRGLRPTVRHGGRARQRRRDAHGDGRDARQPLLAPVQARPRAHAGSAVHAVGLRDRDQDGRVADALPRGVHAVLGAGVERRRPRPGRRHAADADARRHDSDGSAGAEHGGVWLGVHRARQVVGGRGADPR